jgi:hypothetical protein
MIVEIMIDNKTDINFSSILIHKIHNFVRIHKEELASFHTDRFYDGVKYTLISKGEKQSWPKLTIES